MTSIEELEPGDYVKGKDGQLHKIESIWGVTVIPDSPYKTLAKPSQGGFGCVTEDGQSISMWEAMAYVKKEDVDKS